MRPETRAYVWDALTAAQAVTRFVDGVTVELYLADDMRRSAVERQLEVLGEALNRVRQHDPETASTIPDIHRIIAMRNVIAHEYGSVDDVLVLDTARRKVPALLDDLARLLESQTREA